VADETLHVELVDERPAARLSGELDFSTYTAAEAGLASLFGADGDVTLEVADLSFVDSSGIRLFIRLHQSLEGRGRLVLRSPPDHVVRVLEIAGLPELGVDLGEDRG
jgi:anti-anti-sigma factor